MNIFSFFKKRSIEFYCDTPFEGVAPEPFPANKKMPDWYKQIPPFLSKREPNGGKVKTSKKCLPLIDAMSVGYIIPLAGDQYVKTNHDASIVHIGPTSREFPPLVERHMVEQVGGKTNLFKTEPIKFINPWIIRTPPGWSTLFIPCLNFFEDRFLCLSGLVDTDKYVKEINFPGIWLKGDYDDILPAGTPLVTAIPVKRTDLSHNYIIRTMLDNDKKEKNLITKKQESRGSVYTNELRAKR